MNNTGRPCISLFNKAKAQLLQNVGDMKRLLLTCTVCISLLMACKNKEEKAIQPDKSITPANAYNNFFLDSTAVEDYLTNAALPEDLSLKFRNFYYSRNFQYAWLSANGLTEQARGFWNLQNTAVKDNDSLINKDLNKRVNALLEDDDVTLTANQQNTVATELMLTRFFLQYVQRTYGDGTLKGKDLALFIPKKKQDAMSMAKEILNSKNPAYEDANRSYKSLKDKLAAYVSIAEKGGWSAIPYTKTKLKKGTSNAAIAPLKKRLSITGELQANDTAATYDATLEAAVKKAQTSYGITADGVVTDSLIKQLNVPVHVRIQQILVNLNRMRWLPENPNGKLIVTNIPEFKLYVYEGDKEAFNMNVVVGKEGHSTVIFTGDLNQVVFSPYWNVPTSIVKKEILPALEKNGDYLQQHNMEVVKEGDIPEIRQKPGGQNSLGKVKFLFPNAYNIYFHDTPAKDLFNRDNRAYSHGCIRLSDPAKMANYLLQDDKEWTPEKINEAMNSGNEKYVKLKNPIPVVITYYTAWVDNTGTLHFANDIYNHDTEIAARMFTNPATI